MRGILIVAAAMLLSAGPAHAWGPFGHRWLTGIAVEKLPAELPAFLKTKAAAAAIAEFANEPDRWRGAGKTHDMERDSGHFIDGDDAGKVLSVVPMNALPETRQEYAAQLRVGGTDEYKAGWLPYSIVDGHQQLAKDFAYWRAAVVGEKRGATARDRAWFRIDRQQREALILRDLGVWSHYVGDLSQPHHASVHYDNWGDYPNPNNYPQTRGFHVRWENQFVQYNVKRAAIAAAVPEFRDCACPLMKRVEESLADSMAKVPGLFALEGQSPFPDKPGDPANAVLAAQVALATQQLALAAGDVRDLTVLAWRAAEDQGVGYPVIPLKDIESGKVVLTRGMLGGE